MHKYRFRNSTCTLLLVLTAVLVRAQDLNFRHLGVDDGLPSSQVHDIVQDHFGNLWFSTDRGLARYDGYTFKHFTVSDGLTDNTVFKFFVQPDGKIWCTTYNKSVFYFSGEQPVFKPYRYNTILTGISELFVTQTMHITPDEQLYMSYINAVGYLHVDASGKTVSSPVRQQLPQLYRNTLLQDTGSAPFFYLRPDGAKAAGAGQISSPADCNAHDFVRACYFAKTGIAVFVNPKMMNIVRPGQDTLRIPNTFEPISLGRLNDSLFWVGYRYGGVSVYDTKGIQKNHFLSGRSVTRLFTDHENGYWISTLNDGVFHSQTNSVFRYTSAVTTDDWINSITTDDAGRIWLGYYNGNVDVLEHDSMRAIYRSKNKKPAIVAHDASGKNIYYMADLALFHHNTPGRKDLRFNPTCVYPVENDTTWLGGYNNINFIHAQQNHFIRTGFRVNVLKQFHNTLYLGSNKGLYVMRKTTDTTFSAVGPFSGTGITDLCVSGTELAVATRGRGILFYNGQKTRKLDEKDGLANNMINSLYAENDSVLWACTNAGLNKIIKKKDGTFTISTVSKTEGLISNEVTGIVIRNDTVWVATRQGLCFFPATATGSKPGVRNYFLALHRLTINDIETDLPGDHQLPYDKNRIGFHYSAVRFSGTPIVYRYKLDGLGQQWNYTTSLRALYPSLPPGDYTFIVQVKGNNPSWEMQEQRFAFRINPPFWKTWWFIAAVSTAIVLLIYLFFRYRILSYNRDITRELLRQLLKRFTRKTGYVVFREQGKDIRIPSVSVCFVKADGNYIEIHTDSKKYLVRFKIGDFIGLVPDPLEYLRISRSYIIRIDKVQEKSKKDVTINGEKIPVGETYLDELKKIRF